MIISKKEASRISKVATLVSVDEIKQLRNIVEGARDLDDAIGRLAQSTMATDARLEFGKIVADSYDLEDAIGRLAHLHGQLFPAPKMRPGDAGWIQTYRGEQFFVLDPDPKKIHVEDIAHALSNQCRFTGHTKSFYSVAQHSVLVSLICDPRDAFEGLHHDDPEAYIIDLAAPVKRQPELAGYRAIEDRIWEAVRIRFGLRQLPESVKHADLVMLATEKRDLLGPAPAPWMPMPPPHTNIIEPWTPAQAKANYLARHVALGGEL